MIPGQIIFKWEDGFEKRIPFLGKLKGIQYNRQRPVFYCVEIEAGNLNMHEAARLKEWFHQIPSVLRGNK